MQKEPSTWSKKTGSLLAVIALLSGAPAVQAAQTKLLTIEQNVGLPSSGYLTSYQAIYGTPSYSPQTGTSLSRKANRDTAAGGVAQIPAYSYLSSGPWPTQTTVLAAVNANFAAAKTVLASQMAAYMNKLGASSGFFTYAQRVNIQGNPNPVIATIQAMVDGQGRIRYSGARIIPETVTYMVATYTSKAIAASLPAIYAFPNAGKLAYHLVDLHGLQITADTVIDTGGAYDAPPLTQADAAPPYPAGCTVDANGVVSCDPDFGVKCLINKASNAACPQTQPDFVSLLNQSGSQSGFVDYARQLAPVYDNVETPVGSGNYVQQAQVAVSVDTRDWVSTPSNARYVPVPTYGSYLVTNYTCQPGDTSVTNIGCTNNALQFSGYCSVGTFVDSSYMDNWGNWVILTYCVDPSISSSQMYQGGIAYWAWGNPVGGWSGQPFYQQDGLGGTGFYGAGRDVYEFTLDYHVNADGTSTYNSLSNGDVRYNTSTGYFERSCLGITPGNNTGFPAICTTSPTMSAGGGTFHNTGRIGFNMTSNVDRYYVQLDGSYQQVASQVNPTISTNNTYDKTVTMPTGVTCGSQPNVIIDPLATTTTYNYNNDTLNGLTPAQYQYVAPIACH